LLGQPFLGLGQPIQALPVRGGLGCLSLECLVHQIELLAHAGESHVYIGAWRFMRAELRGLRKDFCRWFSAGEPLKAGSVSFSGIFAGISGGEASH
jgi:hypothetical protein